MSSAKKKKANKKKNSQKKNNTNSVKQNEVKKVEEVKCEEVAKKEIDKKELPEKTEEKQASQKDQEVDKQEKKKEPKTEIKSESKELTIIESKDEKPEYVQEMLRKKKRKTIIFVLIVISIFLVVAFSTVFALLNINNTKIAKGVSIKNIEFSDLTIDDARKNLNEILEKQLIAELNIKYNDEYSITLSPAQIEFKYNVEDALNKAYRIGRSDNIILDNYTLLATALFGNEIEIDYTYNEEFLNAFIDDFNSKLPGLVQEPSYYIEDAKLIVESGKDGIEIEKDKLKKQILDSISNRKLNNLSENYSQVVMVSTKKAKASKIDMDKVYSEIHTEPQDAYFELDPYKIYPDVDGVDLQISLDEARNKITGNEERYEFDLKITKAQKTIKDLGTEAFPYVVSSFSTRYDASNTNRSTNLRIAAEKINGTVLLPGEVFSYNKTVGKRTVEEWYKDAKIYADGGVVDGLAGGICPISSTLYNAVLLANLEIVERRNHSFTTSYVAAGRDATVVWGTIDFQFKNSRTYPIKIEASVKNGIAEFKIHGMQEQQEYEINILPRTTASIPYATTYVDDPMLAPGQQVISQAGHLGYKVTTTLVKKLNGVEVSREILSNDTYQPMKAIIRRGPVVAPAPEPVQ